MSLFNLKLFAICLAVGITSFLSVALSQDSSKQIYVQAVQTHLRQTPQMNAKSVSQLKRGQKLEVVSKKGIWFEVQVGSQKGWVSKLFISTHPPVGHAELHQGVKDDLAKASRRRSSSYAVSASTRGLDASARVRDGRELYRSDFDALEKIEKINVSSTDLEKFANAAKLGVY